MATKISTHRACWFPAVTSCVLLLALSAFQPHNATSVHHHPRSQVSHGAARHLPGVHVHNGAHVQPLPQQAVAGQHLLPPASSSSSSLGAGKIIAPLAAGALMGAALQQTGGAHLQTRPQRHALEHHDARIFVDLSYPLHNGTLHWPKFNDFQYTTLFDGERKNPRNESFYLKADAISTAIHLGTHLDAPLHFSKTGWSVDKIPLDRLIDVPVSVFDVSAKVAANRSYSFARSDFMDARTNASLVRARSVVLVYTGVSELYGQGAKAYMGTDTRNISEMRVPGFSAEAARYLVELGIYGVGLDSPSADSSDRHDASESLDPVAHLLFNSNNIYILENVSGRLRELVNASQTARLTIAPLPIVNGSGSPVRLVAILGHDECLGGASSAPLHNSTGQAGYHSSLSMTIFAILLCLAVLWL